MEFYGSCGCDFLHKFHFRAAAETRISRFWQEKSGTEGADSFYFQLHDASHPGNALLLLLFATFVAQRVC